jgi:hypothetical protein
MKRPHFAFHLLLASTALSVIAFWPQTSLAAAPKTAEGFIVSLDPSELVVNLGRTHGVQPNSTIQLFRRLVVTHPFSNKSIVDRFPIGEVLPSEVGERLTIIRNWNGLTRPPQRGDIVVFEPLAAKSKNVSARTASQKKSKALPPDSAALQVLFARNLGQPIENRIHAYKGFLTDFPQSRHVDAVGNEIRAMRSFLKSVREKQPKPQKAPQAKHKKYPLKGSSADTAPIFQGEDLEFTVVVTEPKRVAHVSLLIAPHGIAATAPSGKSKPRMVAEGWSVIKMQPDGDFYYRAKVPPKFASKPGHFDYFIEAVRKDAAVEAIYKSARAPALFTVLPPPAGSEKPGKTEVQLTGKMVDFNQPGEAKDSYFQFEAGITYEVNYKRLRAVRFGMGTINGACTLNDESECVDDWKGDQKEADERAIDLNYAFAEGELELGPWLGVAGRIIGGNHQGGTANVASKVGGMEFRARIGKRSKTRLVAGMSRLDDLGSKGFLDVHIEVLKSIPLKAGVVVTNLPVQGENLGVQLSAQAGYRLTKMVALSGVVGWNARTINHYGFTLGGGLGLEW